MSDIFILSIQTGQVDTHTAQNGEIWTSGYVKSPVEGAVFVGKINIQGDAQHNTKVHGGEHRAILAYSAEHYHLWHDEHDLLLPNGAFGENLTVSGWHEENVCLGDTYRIGDEVRVQVSQPRQPCDNIYRHLGIKGISKEVMQKMRTGWYLRVLQTGMIEAGLPITLEDRPHPDWTIRACHEAMNNRAHDKVMAHALAQIEALEPRWREKLAKA